MVHSLTVRILCSTVMLVSACLICCGCRSADSAGGLLGVSSLVDPVPPQWEPPVETLSSSEFEDPSPAE